MTQRAQTYQGKPCRKCGGTLRYCAQRACVPCHNKDPKGRDRFHRDIVADVEQHRALARNTYLLLYFPQEFEMRGWRQVGTGVTKE